MNFDINEQFVKSRRKCKFLLIWIEMDDKVGTLLVRGPYLVLIFECHFEYGNDLGSKSISNICSNQKVLQMCRFF